MRKQMQKYCLTAFLIITIFQLFSIIINYEDGRFFTKPLLMPLLIAAVFTVPSSVKKYIIVAALLFSFAGDCFLLYDYINPNFFIIGLICFLLTHILYIAYFFKIKKRNLSLFKEIPWLPYIVVAYGFALVFMLFPYLDKLTTPVIIYAIVICSMMLASLWVYKSLSKRTAIFFVLGAGLFIASDSILAINKFMHPFNMASFLIMLTYCAAQYFIVKGFLQTYKS